MGFYLNYIVLKDPYHQRWGIQYGSSMLGITYYDPATRKAEMLCRFGFNARNQVVLRGADTTPIDDEQFKYFHQSYPISTSEMGRIMNKVNNDRGIKPPPERLKSCALLMIPPNQIEEGFITAKLDKLKLNAAYILSNGQLIYAARGTRHEMAKIENSSFLPSHSIAELASGLSIPSSPVDNYSCLYRRLNETQLAVLNRLTGHLPIHNPDDLQHIYESESVKISGSRETVSLPGGPKYHITSHNCQMYACEVMKEIGITPSLAFARIPAFTRNMKAFDLYESDNNSSTLMWSENTPFLMTERKDYSSFTKNEFEQLIIERKSMADEFIIKLSSVLNQYHERLFKEFNNEHLKTCGSKIKNKYPDMRVYLQAIHIGYEISNNSAIKIIADKYHYTTKLLSLTSDRHLSNPQKIDQISQLLQQDQAKKQLSTYRGFWSRLCDLLGIKSSGAKLISFFNKEYEKITFGTESSSLKMKK